MVQRRITTLSLFFVLTVKHVQCMYGSHSHVAAFVPRPIPNNVQVGTDSADLLSVHTSDIRPIRGLHAGISVTSPLPTRKQAIHTNPTWSVETAQACIDLWKLSPEDTLKLKLLQTNLADIQHAMNNPFELARYLHEYKGDTELVEQKFRAMVEWRTSQNIDQVLSTYHPPSLYRYFPAGVLQGLDREGDPIHLERTGAADSVGLLQRYGREEMLQQAIWLREVQCGGKWAEEYESSQGHPVKQFTIVMDMKSLSMKHLNPALLSVGQQVSRLVQDYYPGFTKRMIIVRASPIFKLAFNAFKPFVDESLRDKIIITSGDEEHLSVLDQYMDLDVLPPELGGHGTAVADFDTIWAGGKIPDHEEAPRVHFLKATRSSTSSCVALQSESMMTPITTEPPSTAFALAAPSQRPNSTWIDQARLSLRQASVWAKLKCHRMAQAIQTPHQKFIDNFIF